MKPGAVENAKKQVAAAIASGQKVDAVTFFHSRNLTSIEASALIGKSPAYLAAKVSDNRVYKNDIYAICNATGWSADEMLKAVRYYRQPKRGGWRKNTNHSSGEVLGEPKRRMMYGTIKNTLVKNLGENESVSAVLPSNKAPLILLWTSGCLFVTSVILFLTRL